MKNIYGAVNLDDAEFAKEKFRENWDKKYPNILKSWNKNWAELSVFFEYPQEIRKIIYTTNAVELRLLEAAAEAVKNPFKADTKPADDSQIESFEEAAAEKRFEFPKYKAADIQALSKKYLPNNFVGMIKGILKTEAPLLEDLLLKRIAWCFNREKVLLYLCNKIPMRNLLYIWIF